jgi:CMP-N-acetylneuraminic acid synthetase
MKGILMKTSIVAIVPMRHESERVQGKNYRIFSGRPLYHHIIEVLLSVDSISQIVIDTDSYFIMEDATKYFPQVTLLERPEHLQDGAIPMNDVLLNSVKAVEADLYLQTHSTNPLLCSETVAKAIERIKEVYPSSDSLFSVTRLQTRLWDSMTHAVNHDPAILARTQDLPPIYEENSCLYIFSRQSLEANRNRIGKYPIMYEIDRMEALDIDEELDFQVAEILFQKRAASGVLE